MNLWATLEIQYNLRAPFKIICTSIRLDSLQKRFAEKIQSIIIIIVLMIIHTCKHTKDNIIMTNMRWFYNI